MATLTAVPGRTLEQRMEALQGANQIRMSRAALKQDILAGDVDLPGLLLNPPSFLLSMLVGDLLRAQYRWGDVRVGKMLAGCGISWRKTVGGITPRQRRALAHCLVLVSGRVGEAGS